MRLLPPRIITFTIFLLMFMGKFVLPAFGEEPLSKIMDFQLGMSALDGERIADQQLTIIQKSDAEIFGTSFFATTDVEVRLSFQDGRLKTLHLNFPQYNKDISLLETPLFKTIAGSLGPPNGQQNAARAVWVKTGTEIILSKRTTWVKGEVAPKMVYELLMQSNRTEPTTKKEFEQHKQ